MEVQIYNSLDKPEYLSEVAQFIFTEWEPQLNEEGIYTLEDCVQYLMNEFQSKSKKYNVMLLAINKNIMLGFVFLEEEDMIDRKYYYPWLSSLYVKREYRNQGIANKLIKNVIQYCKNINSNTDIDFLYLWCYPQYWSFYYKKGFSVLENKIYCNKKIYIMKYKLKL